jgi:SNF2 family DNA or RNA helicase
MAFQHTSGPLVLVINYDAVWRTPFGDWAGKQTWDLMVCDESHRIKAPGGKASFYMARIASRAKQRLALTGTPMPHSPLDVYSQYRWLDQGVFGTSFNRFKTKYAIMGGYGNYQVLGFRNEEELFENFDRLAFQVKTEDVLDLPDAVDTTVPVHLEGAAKGMYQTLEKEFYTELKEGEITITNALVKLLRLQQVTSGYVRQDDGTDIELSTAKADALADTLQDLAQDEPVVVFARFQHDLDSIRKTAEKLDRPYRELSGRYNELARWQAGDGTILGVQVQSGGVGIDLTRSRYAIYYSLGFSLGDYLQSRARVHRPGQEHSVTYIHLITQGTVDQKVYQALSTREDVVKSILDMGE